MKKVLLVFAVLLSTVVSAQTSLTGCMGLEFGDSKQTVMSKMSTKTSFKFNTENKKTNTISYLDGTFGGRSCIGAVYHFYDDQLHTVTILVDADPDTKAIDVYEAVVRDLETKYGCTAERANTYQKPYYPNDGYTLGAIRLGYVELNAFFVFEDTNVLSLTITPSLSVKVVYQHSGLAKTAIQERDKQNAKDY